MQLVKQEGPLPGVDLASLKFRNFHHEQQDPDRWVGVFRKYYAGLFISRGQLQEQQGDVDGAIALFTAARIFYVGQPAALNQINRRIELLQSEIEK